MTDIKRRLSQVLGLDPETIGDQCIASAVHERMKACRITDEQAYALQILNHPDEMNSLIETVIIPETFFFRNRDPFEYLRLLISDKAFQARHTPARILSVPCASGEEPYSIAMTFLDAGWSSDSFHVTGMDISQPQINAAQTGAYGKNAFREDKPPYRETYFTPHTADLYLINDSVRQCVSFRQENLMTYDTSTVSHPYDIIFCRNLLIYLHTEARRHVQQLLMNILHQEGYLFLGHAEMLSLTDSALTPVDFKGAFCYCKQPVSQIRITTQNLPPPPPCRTKPGKQTARPATPNPKIKSASQNPVAYEEQPPQIPVNHITLKEAKKLADEGRIAEATQLCEQLIQQEFHVPQLYLLLGILFEQSNHMKEAESHFSRALYLDKDCYEAMVHLSTLKERQGDHSGASRLKDRAERAYMRTTRLTDTITPTQYKQTNGIPL